MKPQHQKGIAPDNGHRHTIESHGGVDLEADIVLNEDNGMIKWVAESLKFSVKHPVITSKFLFMALIRGCSFNPLMNESIWVVFYVSKIIIKLKGGFGPMG